MSTGTGLTLDGGTLTTSGNVNLSGTSTTNGTAISISNGANASITALSGTTTLNGDSGNSTTTGGEAVDFSNDLATVTLAAHSGAAIVLQGGAHSGPQFTVFWCYNGPPTVNITSGGTVSFVSTSTDPGSTFWSRNGAANSWPVFNVNGGGSLVLNEGISSMTNAIIANITSGTVTIAGSGSGTSSGALSVGSGCSLIYGMMSATGALTQSGNISGAGSVTENGPGTLILTGSNWYSGLTTINGGAVVLADAYSNAYSGGFNINAGTLQVGNNGSNTTALTFSATDNGVLAFARTDTVTYSNSITGSGSLVQMGSGTLYLTGVNSYTGTTTVLHGNLVPANTAAMPGYATPHLLGVANGGTLTIASAGWASADLNNLLTNLSIGAFSTGSWLAVDTTGGGLSVTANMPSNMGLVKLGSNTLALSGNDYAAPIKVNVGTLQADSPSTLFGVTSSNPLSVANNATLLLGAGGSGWSGSQIGTLVSSTASYSFATGSQLAIDTTGGGVTVSTAVKGAMGLMKLGPNTLTLSASDTYVGATYVNGGVLAAGAVNTLSRSSDMYIGTTTAGTLDVSAYSGQTVKSLTIGSLGALTVGIGNPLTSLGAASLASGSTINISGTIVSLPDVLMTYGGTGITGSFSNVNYGGGALAAGDLTYLSGSLEITGTALAFSGSATWISTLSSSWSSSSNWADGSGNPGVPGVARPAGLDTATFANSGSQTSIDLTGVNPNLAALSFSTSNYTLTGGSLTLQSNGGTATVTVSSGSQTIASAVTLASKTSIVPASGQWLTISGNIGENPPGQSLSLDGPGILILSGTNNTYTGGTDVDQGTLYVEQSDAIPYGSGLTVASGGTVVFASAGPGATMFATRSLLATPPGRVSAVPEPGTLALLAVGTLAAGLGAWRRRKGS